MFMANSPENYSNSPTEELRSAILTKALSTTALVNRRERGDTLRHLEIIPKNDNILHCRVSTFVEDSQEDGAIVQVSFETHDIDEAHLIVKDDSMSYEECSIDGTHRSVERVDDATAAHLLNRLGSAIL